jgi:hypothetical protein
MQPVTISANEVIPFLWGLIVVITGGLISLVLWTGARLQTNVDMLPDIIAKKVEAVHHELLGNLSEISDTQKKLEYDVRSSTASIDRRVLALEVRCDMSHLNQAAPGGPINGNRHS